MSTILSVSVIFEGRSKFIKHPLASSPDSEHRIGSVSASHLLSDGGLKSF